MNNLTETFQFWAVLSFLVFFVSTIRLFFAIKGKRRTYKNIVAIFMIGIYVSNAIFISSIIYFGNKIDIKDSQSYLIKETKSTEQPALDTKTAKTKTVFEQYSDSNDYQIKEASRLFRESIGYGLIYSTKMSALNVKYQALIPAAFHLWNPCGGIYFILLTILTPIAFGGLIASFFEGLFSFIWFYSTKHFCDIFYFSDLNDKSLLLAKDIRRHQKHSLIVFCNKDKKQETSLLQDAKYNRFILLSRSELSFAENSKHKRYFFEMSKDEAKNVSTASSLVDIYKTLLGEKPEGDQNAQIKKKWDEKQSKILQNNVIFIFSVNETVYSFIDNYDKKKGNARPVNIIILNRFRAAFCNVLLNRPLYKCLKNGRKDFFITVIGAGKCGAEIIKACIWCTQLGSEYSTKIKVIDKNATLLESQFKKNCPELISDYYDISFYDCDVTTDNFYKLLEKECADTNYITVSTGFDDDNLKIAMDVRRFYLQSSKNYENEPMINIFFEGDAYLSAMKEVFEEYHIETYGSDKEFYSYSLVVNSDVEKLAINSNCIYYGEKSHLEKLYEYYTAKEIDRDSNRANAIHLVYKLFLLGYGIIKKSEATPEQIAKSAEYLRQLKVITEENIEPSEYTTSNKQKANLARIEHERWNAYYRSEGWTGIPFDRLEIFKGNNNKRKDYVLKQHACICSNEDLDVVNKIFGKDFRESDYDYITNLSKTLGLEKELEPKINISYVEYVLVKI